MGCLFSILLLPLQLIDYCPWLWYILLPWTFLGTKLTDLILRPNDDNTRGMSYFIGTIVGFVLFILTIAAAILLYVKLKI